jgi:hypothetical protein
VSSRGNNRVSARLGLHLRQSETDRAHRQDSWLSDLSEGQFIRWTIEADLREGEPKRFISFCEELLGDVVLLKKLTTHPYLLGSLSWK